MGVPDPLWFRSVRASLPKDKTGCVTCKKRHLKCPGETPTCSRCQKANRACEYAENRPPDKRTTKLHIRFKVYSTASFSTLSSPRFKNEVERHGFECFLHTSARSLGPAIGWSGWGQFVLQNSEQDTAIRHAAIALGAIHDYRLRTNGYHHQTDNQRLLEFSYRQYGEAIRQVRAQLQSQDKFSPVRAMLACTLLAIFDFVQGDDLAATAHLRAGVAILRNLVVGTGLLDHAIVFRSNKLVADSIGGQGHQPDPEASWDLQKSFTRSFSFLDFWSLRWSNGEALFPEVTLLDGLTIEPTIDDADEIQFQIRYFQPLESRIQEFLRAVKARSSHIPVEIARISFSNTQTELLMRLSSWNNSLSRLCNTEYGSLSHNQRKDIQSVKLNYEKLRIMLLACKENGGFDYRPFDSAFQDIIDMSTSMIKQTFSPAPHFQAFSFSPGVINPLYIAATCCNDVSICQQAIRLLESLQWSEGVWNGQVMAKIARRKLSKRVT